jgi:molecular chaperone DnaJ
MTISFRDAAFGVEAPIVVSRLERCDACGGAGAEPGTKPKTCPACGGRGRQRLSQGFLTVTRPCPQCEGEGRIIEKPCAACRGEGRRRAKKEMTVRIPAGVESNSRLRLTGEGDAGPNGGPAGDLYVVLTVADDDVFTREGDDVVVTLDLPFPTLVLGGEVSVPTLEGSEPLTVPPGTAAGAELRMRSRGMGRLGRSGRGDLLVRVGVHVPASPSKEEKEMLRRYAELTGAPVGKGGVLGKAKKIFS